MTSTLSVARWEGARTRRPSRSRDSSSTRTCKVWCGVVDVYQIKVAPGNSHFFEVLVNVVLTFDGSTTRSVSGEPAMGQFWLVWSLISKLLSNGPEIIEGPSLVFGLWTIKLTLYMSVVVLDVSDVLANLLRIERDLLKVVVIVISSDLRCCYCCCFCFEPTCAPSSLLLVWCLARRPSGPRTSTWNNIIIQYIL